MSELLDIEVRCYPEILRRMAAGEKISSASEEEEKLAAAMLVVEALDNEKKAEAAQANGHDKKAIDIGLGTLALMGLAAPTAVKGVRGALQRARGEVAMPETSAELLKNFRRLLQEREKTEGAKRMAVAAGLGGAAAGALAMKALDKKEEKREKKSSDENRIEEKAADGESVQGTPEPEVAEHGSPAPGSPNARALLDKVLKQLQ